MTRRLQPTDHKSSSYERPAQQWVCGWARDGNACTFGPDGNGRCPAHLESTCAPRREGDRWHCARPVVLGGRCEAGPRPDGSCCHPAPRHPPCQPQLSLRARRGKAVLAVLAVVLGLLTVGLGSAAWHLDVVNPGPLSAAHEPIRGPAGQAHNCGTCHGGGDGGLTHWLGLMGADTGHADSERCLQCHFKGPRAGFALKPHSVAPAQLPGESESESVAAAATMELAMASTVGGPVAAGEGAIRCATCHHEHRGKLARITHLSNTQCQACHAQTFDDFAGTHPEFGPIARARAGVPFDHRTHERDHFGETRPFACEACHQPDASRRIMQTAAYEQACAGCHKAGKEDHHGIKIRSTSLAMFQLPYLELEGAVERWPEKFAQGGQVTPLMQLLLAGDESVAPALASLARDGGDPSDWPEGDDDPALKQALARGLRGLMDELAQDDNPWLRSQIAGALRQPADSDEVDDLYAELRDAADILHGDLAGLLGTVADSAPVRQLAVQLFAAAEARRMLLAQGVARDCRALLPAQRASAVDQLVKGGKGEKGPDCLGAAHKAAAAAWDDFDTLRGLVADAMALEADDPAVGRLAGAVSRMGRRLEFRIAGSLKLPLGDPAVARLAHELEGARLALGRWRQLLDGGAMGMASGAAEPAGAAWQLDAKAGAVLYRTTEHADPVVRALTDAAVAARPGADDADAQAILRSVQRKVVDTECARCHTVETLADGRQQVNWTYAGRPEVLVGFGLFNHSPHVTLFPQGGCGECHALAESKEAGEKAHGFAAHTKAVCTDCHRPGQANSDCLTCHQYHMARP